MVCVLKMDQRFFASCRICSCSFKKYSQKYNLDSTESSSELTLIRNKLYLCLPELNIKNTPNVFLCKNCLYTINIIYVFINQCNETEAMIDKFLENECWTAEITDFVQLLYCIKSYSLVSRNEDEIKQFSSANIKYSSKIFYDTKNGSCEETCRICLQIINNVKFNISYEAVTSIYNKLCLCCPELNLWGVLKPVLCKSCCDVINIMYHFKDKCFKNEYQINKHSLFVQNFINCTSFLPSVDSLDIKEEIKSEEFEIDDVINKSQLKAPINCNYLLKNRQNNYECFICKFQTKRKCDILVHLQTSHEYVKLNVQSANKTIQCSKGKYRTESHLKHIPNHKSENPFKCSQCDYSATYRYYLKQHTLTHTGEKLLKCPQCIYSTNYNFRLKQHVLIHTNIKPFKCNVCGHSTKEKVNLKKHMIIHTGNKPFECAECGHCAREKGSLRKHILIHTKERPFKCCECGYGATLKSSLKQHMLTHTREKSFKCSKCNYCARKKSLLKIHLLAHAGEKPFKCNICGYGTTVKASLKQHMLIHTKEKPFKCNQCDYYARARISLKKHMIIHRTENTLNVVSVNIVLKDDIL